MILVLIAVATAFVLAMAFMAAQASGLRIADNGNTRRQARLIAESALDMAVAYIGTSATWRTDRTSGLWVSNQPLLGGTFTLYGEDGQDSNGDGVITGSETDGTFSDSTLDAVTLTASASYKGATWKSKVVVCPAPKVLMVVPNDTTLTAYQQDRRTMLAGWGMSVTLADSDWTQDALTTAAAAAQAVYVVGDVTDSSLGTKLKNSAVGCVIEGSGANGLLDEFSLLSSSSTASFSAIDVQDNSHYITQPFSLGVLTIFSSAKTCLYGASTSAGPAASLLAKRPSTTNYSLLAYEAGVNLADGTMAFSRRVMLPWSGASLNINSLADSGRTILRRSLEWCFEGGSAANAGLDGIPDGTYSGIDKNSNLQIAYRVNMPQAGTVKSISVYLNGVPPKDARFALYTDAGTQPGSLIIQTPRQDCNNNQYAWVTLAVTPTHLPAGNYWVAFAFELQNMSYKRKSGAGNVCYKNYDALDNGFLATWGMSNSSYSGSLAAHFTYMPDGQQTGVNLWNDAVAHRLWIETR